jgi:peptidoglycan/LPS O-acetylase OafA/YrhL
VDLFFALSGFVLAYRYDARFAAGLTFREFLQARLVRLYPLFALGLVLGLGLRAFPPIRAQTYTGGAMTGHELATATVLNIFLLPAPNGSGNHFLFPADLPAWSLFFEFWIANLGFALFWKKLRGLFLAVAIILLALLLLVWAGVYRTFDMGPRWETFGGGFIRAGLPFLIGVALARIHSRSPVRLQVPSWLVLVLVPTLLFVPGTGTLKHVYDFACLFLIFPCLIYLGAEAVERKPQISAALGDASYAAYIIHVPLLSLLLFLAPTLAVHPSPWNSFFFAAVVFCLALPLAQLYDLPARKALRRMIAGKRLPYSAA